MYLDRIHEHASRELRARKVKLCNFLGRNIFTSFSKRYIYEMVSDTL